MSRVRVAVLVAVLGAVPLLGAAPVAAGEPAPRSPVSVNRYDHVVADFGAQPREGVSVAALLDAFRFTDEDGQPAATAGLHADIAVDGAGYVCELDAPAEVGVARDLSTADQTTSLAGECGGPAGTQPFSLRAEVTLVATGELAERREVIRTDTGICVQRFRERAAAASGTASVRLGDLLDETVVISAGPTQRIEHVDEVCVTTPDL